MTKPVRTLHVYDKGSNYVLTDTDDNTTLYHIHFNDNTLPHMTVTRTGSGSNPTIGTASFIPTKKLKFFATASLIRLTLHGRETPMDKTGGVFSTDKRAWQSSRGTMWWKGGVTSSPFLALEDGQGNTIATYKNQAYSGRVMGVFEIFSDPMGEELLDEVVVSGIAMVSEQKTTMGQTAAAIQSAG